MYTLNERISAYLVVNNIPFALGDYATGQPDGMQDEVLRWDAAKLGAQPTAEQLDAALAVYETRQVASAVRAERDAKLAASDWTQVADAPVDKAAWATYRQALRDLTVQAGFPSSITWPSEPA